MKLSIRGWRRAVQTIKETEFFERGSLVFAACSYIEPANPALWDDYCLKHPTAAEHERNFPRMGFVPGEFEQYVIQDIFNAWSQQLKLQFPDRTFMLSLEELSPEGDVQIHLCTQRDGNIRDRRKVFAALHSDEARIRWEACLASGVYHMFEVGHSLTKIALSDDDWDVRYQALWAMARLRDPNSAGPIASLLSQSEPALKVAAIEALAWLPAAIASQPLLEYVTTHEDDECLEDAWLALSTLAVNSFELRSQLGEMLEDTRHYIRLMAARTLAATGKIDVLGPIFSYQRHGERAIWEEGVRSVHLPDGHLLHFVRRELIAALDDEEPITRVDALEGLGWLGGHDAVEAIASMLHDSDKDVRRVAIRELSHQPEARTHQPLLNALAQCLRDPDPEVREEAIEALDALLGKRAISYIEPLLKDRTERVREAARLALDHLYEEEE